MDLYRVTFKPRGIFPENNFDASLSSTYFKLSLVQVLSFIVQYIALSSLHENIRGLAQLVQQLLVLCNLKIENSVQLVLVLVVGKEYISNPIVS